MTSTKAEQMWESVEAGKICLTLLWERGALAQIGLNWRSELQRATSAAPLSEFGEAFQIALENYVQGRIVAWPTPPLADVGLTEFGLTVLQTLRREVGHGRTVTYGELAAMSGRPGAARAVGSVMARNPWPMYTPCHRVLAACGLGGFSGAGLPMKRYLLELEGAPAPK